ncbi:MAG: 16S rRNA (guanine(966)-N(2))-methyltransferase RsmD [Planctomycetaceae bacterium]
MKNAVRIIAGEFRRRKLLTNPGLTTRPITDRVKEILFSRLEHELVDKRVADIFSGTGTLGFESLSRGAAGVVFIELDHKAFELLQHNVQMLKVEDRSLCWRADVFRCSFRPEGVPHLLPFDIVFFDPPYKMASEIKPGLPLYKSLIRLARPDVTSAEALMIVRTSEGLELTVPDVWILEEKATYSTMDISIFRKSSEPAE